MAIFSCLALLENETHLLYEAMFSRADNSQVKLLLRKLSLETKTHRDILEQMSRDFGQAFPPAEETCKELMGELYVRASESSRSVKEEVSRGIPIMEAVNSLIDFEKDLSEEYVTEMHSTLNALVEVNPAAKRILEDIAADEKRHVATLKLILEIASKASNANTE